MITRGRAGICTGVGGGIVVCTRLLLLVGSSNERLLGRLKVSNATLLGRWRGFKLHYGVGRRAFFVKPLRPLGNFMIASTITCTEKVLSWLWHRHDNLRR